MRYPSAALALLIIGIPAHSALASGIAPPQKCAMKTELIEKHLQVLENKYRIVQKADASETEARDHVKRRVYTLLVDVRRSLERPLCDGMHRTRLEDVATLLEKMMQTDI
jgi:hypothetical protein